MKPDHYTLLQHLYWFASHHPFQVILAAVVLGIAYEKTTMILASRKGHGPKLREAAMQPRQWLHLVTALAAFASVAHEWLSGMSDVLDIICK
jgi:hypothetical protein